MITEKMMEDAICANPEKYLHETGLKLLSRQYRVGSYIFDILFEDRHGAKLIVELQKGTLDRVHTYKIIDYYDEYKERNPEAFVELMVIANVVPRERQQRLSSYGITWKEISVSDFIVASGKGNVEISKNLEKTKNISGLPKGVTERTPTSAESNRFCFWEMFLKKVNAKTTVFNHSVPTKKHYIGPTIDKLQYLAVSKSNESWVEVCIQQAEASEDIYKSLVQHRQEIENAFGKRLNWVNDPSKQRCKIMAYPISVGFKDRCKWEEITDRLAQDVSLLVLAVQAFR